MSSGLGLDKDSIDKTIYDMIIGENDVEEVIDHGTIDNLDILLLMLICRQLRLN